MSWKFWKKKKFLQISANRKCGILTYGFSYILVLPDYLAPPKAKTGIVLNSGENRGSYNHDFHVNTLMTLESIIMDRDVVRFVFAQKYTTSPTVSIPKFQYTVTVDDYRNRRLKTDILTLGNTYNLTIYFNGEKNIYKSDVTDLLSEIDDCFSVLRWMKKSHEF
jgi:hypothetical protein